MAEKRDKQTEAGDKLDQSIQSFRDSLEHSVTVSLERLQEVLDEAVERGRMTRRDAEKLIADLLDKGRKQRDGLLEELEKFGKEVNRQSTKLARQAREVTERPLAQAEKLRRRGNNNGGGGNDGKFPIAGYDDLTATEIRSRLGELSQTELRQVRDREEQGAARKTVLGAVDKKLGA